MITATVQSVEKNVIKVKALNHDYELKAFFGCGVHNKPAKGERVIMTSINGNLYGFAGGDNDIEVDLEAGERRIFSSKDGAIVNYIHLGVDTLNLNGNDSYAVRYKELKTEFNKLKSDFNSLVSTFNAHIHTTTATVSATAAAGIIAPTLTKSTQNNSDITKSKSDKVMLK